ncbi:hypothetical protein NC651_037198 [Populus alba x Populus x berolinensis]|nr:hypothetical protein NC651_037198 [Populus alba x Populus x berolinensis]
MLNLIKLRYSECNHWFISFVFVDRKCVQESQSQWAIYNQSARELIRFKGNRLNGRSCHRGLFIFQSMCSFSNEDCDHQFMKKLTKVHEKHILTNLPNNKVQKSQFDCRDPSAPFLPCNHLLSPCTSGTFES